MTDAITTPPTSPADDVDDVDDVEVRPDATAPAEARRAAIRPPADRFMRSLLRIHDAPDSSLGAAGRVAMSTSILVSAVRCTITYLIIPIVAPIIGVIGVLGVPLSMALCAVAAVFNVRSVRRFWQADHPKRWFYTAFAAVVLCFLAFALVSDTIRLLT